jgi:hypothetical protein
MPEVYDHGLLRPQNLSIPIACGDLKDLGTHVKSCGEETNNGFSIFKSL